MNERATLGAYGVLTEPATLTIQRLLPGPIDRVWAYLTQSDLRRKWLASGQMELKVGAPFEFVWRNSELTDPPGERPSGFSDEHRMQSRITEVHPRLAAYARFVDLGPGDELERRKSERRIDEKLSALDRPVR